MTEMRKQNKTKRNDFRRNLYLSLNLHDNKACQNNDVTITRKNQQKGEVVFCTIKKHFKHENHAIKILVEQLFSSFTETYKPLCNCGRIKPIFDDSVKLSQGEESKFDQQDYDNLNTFN
jgi:hypothetical protein